ncbi:MAG TPA: cupin domain-containing protein [Noviherbaspirillum sp.]|uniref:cupin domain-containing protein n=1 Tax=Noviherbaspirillum sp. TaxID=1926288 RepID=UPI002B47B9FC|nr:cupin domain-containing protein [Noviherbaspirillum sp.]HJV86177.1 cupin domain-containing protein [Noviherbaspirillum sp.]
MDNANLDVVQGRNFSGAQVGELTDLHNYQFYHPLGKGRGFPGKLFLQEPLQMTGMEVSLNKLPAGQGVPFYHQHREHEELYIFLKGSGQFLIDGKVIEVREGTVIRVAPEGVRTWRNHSQEDLYYIVVQAKAGSMQAKGIEDGMVLPEKVDWPA